MASFQERMALLGEQLPTKKSKDVMKQEAAAAATTSAIVVADEADFVLTTNGQVGSLRTSEGSALPTKLELQATNITIAIIDVSDSMRPYKEVINGIVSEFVAKSSAANLPAGQLNIVCFASDIRATIDMSQPYAHNIRYMNGGTNYGSAFRHTAQLISQTRTQYPNARFNVAFMTDGGDCDDPKATPAALAELHEQLFDDRDQLTAVFFSSQRGARAPDTLHKVSKPSIPVDQIPVMLLTDKSYFANWLLGALETCVTRTSLNFSVLSQRHHVLLNNNGETITGSLFFTGVAEDVVVDGVLTNGEKTTACRVLVKKPEAPAPLAAAQIMQLLQTIIDDALHMPQSEIDSALAQIKQVVSLAESAEVRAKLTAAELTLLKRAMSNAFPASTGGSLTSRRADQVRSLTETLNALMYETHLTTGKMRRAARAIQKLDTRVQESASKVRQRVSQLQDALLALQKTYISASQRPTRSNGGTLAKPRPYGQVERSPIDPAEVVVSIWTGPPTDNPKYMGDVALNMGNVRAEPDPDTPWIGLTVWAEICNDNLTTTTKSSIQIGIPVFDHHPSQLTETETKVVSLMAPLLCGLFATAQLIIDQGHVAVSQLFTIIGHTLQTKENRDEAEQFANVLLPYAWHLYRNLGYDAMTTQPIADRYKDDKNCIGSATAWLGFVYCYKQMVTVSPLTPEQQYKVYKQELLRTVAKRLHDTSDQRNAQQLEDFVDTVQRAWPTLTSQTIHELNVRDVSSWSNLKTLQATVDGFVNKSVKVTDPTKVDLLLRVLLDAVGSEIKSSYRLAPGVLRGKEALRPWTAWTAQTALNLSDLYYVVKYTVGNNTMSEADAWLGCGYWTSEVKSELVNLLIRHPSLLTPIQWWVLLLLRPSVKLIHPQATVENLVADVDNLNLLATNEYPHVRKWFQAQIQGQPWETVIQTLAKSKFVADSRLQYWCITELKTPQHLFAPFQGPAQELWRDGTRNCKPSMNGRLSKPGTIVSDNGTRRVVNKVEFVKNAQGLDTHVVSKVTFLDGSTMRRNIAGGQRNSVTAQALCKDFSSSYGQYDRVKVLCAGLDSIGLIPQLDGDGPVVERVLTPSQIMKIGLTNIVGYVCARYQGHWVLERIYQKTHDGKYVDVMARGDLAYFSETEEHNVQ